MSMTRSSTTRVSAKKFLLSFLLLFSSSSVTADTLLIWLAEERAGVRDLAAISHPVVRELRAQLPPSLTLLTPLMDLTDQMFIDADILWQGDQDTIQSASARYSTEHILVARIIEGARPLTEWLIWLSGDRKTISTQGEWSAQAADVIAFIAENADLSSTEDVTNDTFSDEAEAQPLDLAPIPSLAGYQVIVYNLIMPMDFLDATETLREMFGESAVRMISFNAGILRVNIDYEGALSGLQRELQAHPRFSEISDARLEFTWN
ncbi:DUF2066 domain-containing protein [Nitrincola schmidtii]|uniref:DUF2066 domain-containing protein n=1 Tax=Nitrincola schmidtii TaxID=1730894 RepID=UPI00124BD854|nr:DUF2066 domain-containing protein [Nitrincola schmidtii]